MKILVVENEAIVAMEIAHELEKGGHTVIGPAASVSLALRLLKSDAPDAAILDIWLGKETSAAVAAALLAASIPFIVLSAHPPDIQPLIFRSGQWLMKPHAELALLEAITALGEPVR